MSHEKWANELLERVDLSGMGASEQLLAASVLANSIARKVAIKASDDSLLGAIAELKETLGHMERMVLERVLNKKKEKTP